MAAPTTADNIGLGITIQLQDLASAGMAAIGAGVSSLAGSVQSNVAKIDISLSGLGRSAGEAGGSSGWQMLALGISAVLDLAGRAAGAIEGVVGRLVHLGSNAEDTTIAIASMLQAGQADGLGEGARDFQRAMQLSSELMAKIRYDAQRLPGEAQDLINIFRGTLQGGIQAGASSMEVEAFSAQMMAVTQLLQIDSETAGREIAMIFEDRAGAHNKLFMRLRGYLGEYGDATAFNQLNAADKLALLTQALGKFEHGVAAVANTWTAVSSTAVDSIKGVAREASGPAFQLLKQVVTEANDYYSTHKAQIIAVAAEYGGRLATALQGAWQWFTATLQAVGDWYGAHREALGTLADNIGGFVDGALAGLRVGFEILAGAVGFVAENLAGALNRLGEWGTVVANVLGFNMTTETSYRAVGEAVGYVAAGLVALRLAHLAYNGVATIGHGIMVGLKVATVAYNLVMDGTLLRYGRAIVLYGVMNAALIAQTIATWAHTAATSAASIAVGIAETAQWGWNLAMAANPIGIIIILIGLLVVALVGLVLYWDRVKFAALDAILTIVQALQSIPVLGERIVSPELLAGFRLMRDQARAESAAIDLGPNGGFAGRAARVLGVEGEVSPERAAATDFTQFAPAAAAGGAATGAGGGLAKMINIALNLDGKQVHRVVVDEDGEVRDMEGREE